MTQFSDGVGAFADLYDGFLVDQWGVLHDGAAPYPGAQACLARLMAAGKPVVLVSNSGRRSQPNAERLARLGFPPDSYTAIVTSGEATWHDLKTRDHRFTATLGRRCLLYSSGGDRSIVEGLDLDLVGRAEAADFILLAGLDPGATLAAFEPALAVAMRRGLPLVCANPDIVGIAAGGLVPTPGAMARRYAALGGTVRLIGKPHPEIYRHCRAALGGLPPQRVVAIGDSLQHDIAGAAAIGHATAFVTGGIHAAAFAGAEFAAAGAALGGAAEAGESARRARLAALAAEFGGAPDWAIPAFRW